MEQFEIVHAVYEDIPEIMEIYSKARAYMKSCGNTDQWDDSYPSKDIVRRDISDKNFYKIMAKEEIAAVFAFILGEDPTYQIIDGGRWRKDVPYGTVHRLASSGKYPHVARSCFDFALEKVGYIRIDTHEKNLAMQRAVFDYGFKECGTIYVADGSARIAYDYVAFWLENSAKKIS